MIMKLCSDSPSMFVRVYVDSNVACILNMVRCGACRVGMLLISYYWFEFGLVCRSLCEDDMICSDCIKNFKALSMKQIMHNKAFEESCYSVR